MGTTAPPLSTTPPARGVEASCPYASPRGRENGRRLTGLLVVAWLLTQTLSWSVPVAAQSGARVWRVGAFHVGLDHVPPSLAGLREGLRELGYEEGRNLRLDWRNLADEDAAHETAREFVRNRVDLIVAFENQTVRAAKAATSQIPVVFLHATDAVEAGLVRSLARPGGNMTGFAGFIFDFPEKSLELFKELVPTMRRLLLLSEPEDPETRRLLPQIQRAAALLKLGLTERQVSTQADIERVFAALRPGTVDGVFVASSTIHVKFTSLLLRLTREKHLPLPGYRKEWVREGALFSYAPDIRPIGRDAAGYVDRILRGTKAADLPVQRPTRFELVVSLRVARALGLVLPQTVLARADQLVE